MSQILVTGEAKIRDIQGPVVANSGVISALDGDASQYVRGDGTLADFPTSTGGGSSVSYYLNSSVSQGTIGGVAYRQLGKTPISGAGTDIAISSNGYVASYITDANDPALLEVPAGNFNCEFYFSVNNDTGNPYVYAELYKYDGTTFTLLGTSVGVPEYITEGTVINPYYFAVPVATSVLSVTDRISIRIYVNVDGRTVTLHTENNHLCQVVTTFSKGLISLNNLTRQNQFFQTGTSGTDFNISSTTATHTFNIPSASDTNRGLVTTGTQTFAGQKTFGDSTLLIGGLYLYNSSGGSLAGYMNIMGLSNGVRFTSGTNIINTFTLPSATGYTYTFPSASGTLALTSDLSSYVPYTGATANVNLGTNSLFAYDLYANGNGTNNANLYLKQGTASLLIQNGYSNILATGTKIGFQVATSAIAAYYADLQFSSLTAQRTYTLPDASGTLALLSADQTFTGINSFDYGINYKTGASLANVSGYISQAYAKSGTGAGSTLSLKISDGNSVKAINLDFVGSPATYTYTFPASSGTISLLESTQTFSGTNTFSSASKNESGILLKNGFTTYSNSYTSLGGNIGNLIISGSISGTPFDNELAFTPSTSNTYTFPNASGTIALTSDIPSLANYVTLNTIQTISANKTFSEFGFFDKGVLLKQNIYPSASGYNGIGAISGGFYFSLGQTTVQTLLFNTSTPYQYTFPNATGTLALGTGTTNYHAKWTGTNTIGNSLIWDNGTNVGIGNTNTSYTLDVSGTVRGTTSAYFATASGSVGIGTSSPLTNTHIAGTNGVTDSFGQLLISTTNTATIDFGGQITLGGFFNGTTNQTAFGAIAGRKENSTANNALGYLSFSTQNGTITERMRITSAGVARFNTQATYSSLTYEQTIQYATSPAGIWFGNSFNSNNNVGLQLRTSNDGTGVQALTITSGGGVCLGYTSDAGYQLRMSGYAYVGGNIVCAGDITVGNLAGSGNRAVYSNASGQLTNSSSDKTLKTNVTKIAYGLDSVLNLNPISFNWIDTENMGTQTEIGFIAQEVKEIIPEVIGINNNETLSIDYPKMVAVLTKAIQEMNTKLDEQNQTIQNLQEQINILAK